MTDLPKKKKTDWSGIEEVLEPDSSGKNNLPSTPSLDTPQPLPAHPLMERFGNPQGLLMQFQQGNIARAAAVDALRIWHKGQLRVAEVQIEQAVKVHTAKARLEAERFLAQIDNEFLEYLSQLGLRNVGERQEMLVRLGDQTSKTLKEVQEADWPPSMRDSTVARVMEMHEEFAEKLSESIREAE